MKKILIFVLNIWLINCFTPNYFHYSKKWIIVGNIFNECVYESSFSKETDLIIFYKLKLEGEKNITINHRNFLLSKKSILLEIYWYKDIPENFVQTINSKLSPIGIINVVFYTDEFPWTRLNDTTLISDSISNLDLYSNSSVPVGSLKKSKSLVIFNNTTDNEYEKIIGFLEDEFKIYRRVKYNHCDK